ncbi:FAM210B protein [Hibiscus syriacus]|uniref:FAM210B protein n=1 Tax=Hibiscus syriacus TaxID=106335 RepID=A0A6A2YEY4_HIBSY|nr:FAM210B protein [Hibiscus syriacus]
MSSLSSSDRNPGDNVPSSSLYHRASYLLRGSQEQLNQSIPLQNQHPQNPQLTFSVKPSFMDPGGDYHRFATTEPHRVADQELDAIVVIDMDYSEIYVIRISFLQATGSGNDFKRKSDVADQEVESGDWARPPGHTEVVGRPLQTPVSGKGGNAQKTSRLTKNSKSGPQAPSNLDNDELLKLTGSPGNNVTPGSPCRYDSSLGLLTRKFINLIKQAEDCILDLNKAAGTLELTVSLFGPGEVDENVATLQLINLNRFIFSHIRWLFVTEEDIKSLPCFQNETLIAIKAPHGTTLEVPDPGEAADYPQRRYRIVLRSSMGPIDVYLVSQFEEKLEEIQGVDPPPNFPSTSGFNENPVTTMVPEESRGKDIEMKRQDTTLIEWNKFDSLNEDHGMAAVSSPCPQTPPSNVTEVHFANSTGK